MRLLNLKHLTQALHPKYIGLGLLTMVATSQANAQMVAGESYMKGNFIEIGISGPGAFEGANTSIAPPPAGMHPRSMGANLFGFVANPQMDGWAQFNGDFFVPGTPENGFGFTIEDNAGSVYFSTSNNATSSFDIPFSVINTVNDPVTGCMSTMSDGNYTGSGYNIDFNVEYRLNVNDLFYTTIVTIQNNSGQVIDDFYYYRNVDPDNNVSLSGDFSTQNTVVSQPTPTCGLAHVKATATTPHPSYMGFAGVGPNFRVTRGGFTNTDGKQIWTATGLVGTVGSTLFGDEAISLAYRIQNFAPSQIVTIRYVVILDDAAAANAIDNLFYFDYQGSLGGPAPECTPTVDSALTCAGNPVSIQLNGPNLGDFTWTWSPATGLDTTAGPEVEAAPATSTTYVVTGVPTAGCFTTPITQTIVVDVLPGPDAAYVDPGPQCSSFDLNNLTYSDANNVPGTGHHFYTHPPGDLADTLLGMFTGSVITENDTVYLVYYDPVLGCINSEQIVIDWGGFTPTMSSVIQPTCGVSNGEITVSVTGAVGALSYSINGGTPVSSNVFTGLSQGMHTILIADSAGCTETIDTVLAEVNTLSIDLVNITNTLCFTSCDGAISVNASGGTGAYSYSINGSAFQVPNTFTGLCKNIYTIVVKDAAGCTVDTTVTLTSPPVFTIAPSNNDTICITQTAVVSASTAGGTGAPNYTWDNGLSAAASHTVDPTGTTVYNVFATDANGCITPTVSILIVENPALNVIALSDQTICPGTTANISAMAGGGNGGPYTYAWSNNVTPLIVTGQNQTVAPNVQTTYVVTVTDGCGTPAASDTIVIGIFNLPVVSFTADTLNGCTPVVVNFTNTTDSLLSGSCLWDFGDGTISNTCNDQHIFTEPGCSDVSLTVTTVNGCIVDTTYTSFICVYPYPVPEFTWNPNPADVLTPEVTFTNLTVGGGNSSWNFAGLDSSTLTSPVFTFPVDSGGVYNVCLTEVNNDGCVAEICHDVIVNEVLLVYAPNAFTPNGDGINDVFLPIFQGEEPKSYELFIFNRWGQVVFQSSQDKQGWDGNHNNIKAKSDVYVWKIKIRDDISARKIEYNGHVTLLR